MSLNQFTKEQIQEMSLIEIAYELMVEKNEPFQFQDLADEVASLLGLNKQEMKNRIVQFYTDINIDGRFTSLGENRWGLKTWYPIDSIEEEVVHAVKPKKKKAKKAAVVDDFDEVDDESDDDDFDDLDTVDDLDDAEDEDLLLDDDDLADDDEEEEDDVDIDEDLIDDEDFGLEEDEEEEEEDEEENNK